MSKKDKIFDPKKEPKKENIQEVEESQESKLAKQVIDLQTIIEVKNKDLAHQAQIIEALKNDLTGMAQEYKNQLLLKMDEANKILKIKQDENDKKFRNELAYAKKYAIKDQALDLIDIVADFSSAVNHPVNDPKIANWLSGFKMYLVKFNNLLSDLNINEIKVSVGQEFDPNIMEPFETIKDPTKKDNTVATILKPGYKLYDHVLKPVLVKVVKNN